MTSDLRPELLTPTPPYVRRLMIGSVVGVFGVVVMAAGYRVRTDVAHSLVISPRDEIAAQAPELEGVTMEETPPDPLAHILLVFEAGGAAYIKLADVGDRMPAHDRPIMFEYDANYVTSAIARVASVDVAARYRPWLGKDVIVDGACRATVEGFAVVARVTGDPEHAAHDLDHWTADSVMKRGTPVLAARLAGCTGGVYARDASLPPIVVPVVVEDAPLARAAKDALRASPEVQDAQAAWHEVDPDGGHWLDADGTTLTITVARHPTTGTTWVSAFARFESGCGAPELRVWKLFRADADGKLVATASTIDAASIAIDALVDVEGDGELEVITTSWLDLGHVVSRASGEVLAVDEHAFFGCAC